MNKDIFIILPFKESLNPKLAGAVSLYVKDTTSHSKFKKKISIYFQLFYVINEKINIKAFLKIF